MAWVLIFILLDVFGCQSKINLAHGSLGFLSLTPCNPLQLEMRL